QGELGETLRRMARAEAKAGGSREAGIRAARDEFYRGETARRIAEFHRAEDGPLSREDLADFRVEVAPALTTPFGAYEVAACGFWCQGPVLLQMLNLLDGVNLAALGHNSPAYLHRIVETVKLAFADRDAYYGDPRFVAIPAAGLLSEAYAGARRVLVGARAWPDMPPAGDPHRLAAERRREAALRHVRHAGRRRPAAGDAPGLPQRHGLRHGAAGRGGGAAPGLAQLPRLVLAARDGPRQGGDRAEDPARDPRRARRARPRRRRVARVRVARGRGVRRARRARGHALGRRRPAARLARDRPLDKSEGPRRPPPNLDSTLTSSRSSLAAVSRIHRADPARSGSPRGRGHEPRSPAAPRFVRPVAGPVERRRGVGIARRGQGHSYQAWVRGRARRREAVSQSRSRSTAARGPGRDPPALALFPELTRQPGTLAPLLLSTLQLPAKSTPPLASHPRRKEDPFRHAIVTMAGPAATAAA